MRQNSFWIIVFIGSLLFSIVSSWAWRSAGKSRLLLLTAIGIVIVSSLGMLDWRQQSPRETPIITYALLGVLPLVCIAATIYGLAQKKASFPLQVLVGSIAGLVAAWAALFSAFFP